MQTHHRERVEAAAKDPQGLWKLAKWARNRGTASQAFTLALKNGDEEVTEPEEKAELLQATFFPPHWRQT